MYHFILLKKRNTITPENYYWSLNRFFDYVEREYKEQKEQNEQKEQKITVEIAAHPSSDYPNLPPYFGNRNIIIGKTIECVRKSRFVISHYSTSINMAVLYEKPVIFIETDEMIKKGGAISKFVHIYASWLGKTVHNIDRPIYINWDKELTIDKKKYADFQNSFIKKESGKIGDKNELSWQIFINRLNEL